MSSVLNCDSCGGTNQLPEGKTSMFCAFCGNAIEKKIVKGNNKDYVSRIKSKPIVTSPDIETDTNTGVIVSKFMAGNKFSRRVDGGYEVYDELTKSWEYYEDEIREVGGYKLSLKNKEIKSLEEVTDWFTDDELETIKYLDLSHNNLTNIESLNKFKNAQIINLEYNSITELNYLGRFNHLQVLCLNNNQLSKINGLFTNNHTAESLDSPTFKSEEIYSNILIYLENNPISTFSKKVVDNLKNLMLTNNGNLELKLSEEPKTEICQIFNELNTTASAKEVSTCGVFWFNTIARYLEEYYEEKNSKWPNKGSIKISKDAFNKWLKEFENEYKSEPKILNCLRIYYNKDDDYIQYNLLYPDAENIKRALKLRTGYNLDEITAPSSNCFIATATMGSYDHPQVMELRNFRDDWILTKKWGESFVKWYYHYGEKVAKVIDKSFILKKFSYLLIVKPLVYLSRILKF